MWVLSRGWAGPVSSPVDPSGAVWFAASLTALLAAGRPRAPFSAMAPAPRFLLSPPTLLLLLLLLLSLALLGARAESAAGSVVPAQSRCRRRGRAGGGGVFVSCAGHFLGGNLRAGDRDWGAAGCSAGTWQGSVYPPLRDADPGPCRPSVCGLPRV